MPSRRGSDLKYKLMTVELLNLAKNFYTFKELSQILGLPERTLSRYVKLHVLPSIDRAVSINKRLQDTMSLEDELKQRVISDKSGFLDLTRVIADTLLLERTVQRVINAFSGIRITKVVSTLSENLPLATLVAHRLGVGLVIATPYRTPSEDPALEEVYAAPNSTALRSLYIPSRALRRGDIVLVISLLMATGELEMSAVAMIKMIQSAVAQPAGLFALISVGRDWRPSIQKLTNCPIETVMEIGSLPAENA
jgi:adenine/guanine phosphoribosyltransferase-like PRPP-binding protein